MLHDVQALYRTEPDELILDSHHSSPTLEMSDNLPVEALSNQLKGRDRTVLLDARLAEELVDLRCREDGLLGPPCPVGPLNLLQTAGDVIPHVPVLGVVDDASVADIFQHPSVHHLR
jgi:hypothetical protein